MLVTYITTQRPFSKPSWVTLFLAQCVAIRSWRNNWTNLSTFFKYPQEIRTVIYTTSAVESVHRQFRKVTKNRALFPNDDALKKMLYLAYRDLSKKWTLPIQNWAIILSNFSVYFKERFHDF